jgi:hypothetical protein
MAFVSSKHPQPQTLVKLLRNAAGEVIGHTERDLETGIATPFCHPKGLQPPPASVQGPPQARHPVQAVTAAAVPPWWPEFDDMLKTCLLRRAQARPQIALGACWPDVPAAPQTLDRVVEQHRLAAR